MLLPERVSVLEPFLVRPPVPEIRPEKVVLLVELVVRVPAPRVMLPDPVMEPRVSLNPPRLKVPPATLRFEVSAMRSAAPRVSVPAFTVVVPSSA